MTSLREALQWSGKPVVSLFVVAPAGAPAVDTAGIENLCAVREYPLEDADGVFKGLHTREYDLTLDALPEPLKPLLEEVLRRGCRSGARVAWLGLEGSFDFEH